MGTRQTRQTSPSEWPSVEETSILLTCVCFGSWSEVLQPILNLLLRVTHEEGEFVDFCRLCLFKRSRAFVRILHVMQISFYDAPAASEIV